jgi:hypothetical protein
MKANGAKLAASLQFERPLSAVRSFDAARNGVANDRNRCARLLS